MKKSLLALGILLSFFFRPSQTNAQIIGAGVIYGSISTCAGTASASPDIIHFLYGGSGLTGNFTATAPSGFEISFSAASGYTNTLILAKAGTATTQGTLYVRASAAAPAGKLAGSVILSTTGAQNQLAPVSATINALPGVNAVVNQTVANGNVTLPVNFAGSANTFSWVNTAPSIGLAASGVGNIPSFKVKNPGANAVTATITATPINAGYAYVPNFNSNNVQVINLATYFTVATIPVGVEPDEVAVSPDGSKVYVVNDASSNVSVISTATNTVTATIQAGNGLSGVAVNPTMAAAYFTNFFSDSVTVVNTNTNKVTARIHVGHFPRAVSVSPNGLRVYVANTSSNSVTIINAQTNQVVATVLVGSHPSAMAISPDGLKVFVTNLTSNNISVIRTDNNTIYAITGSGPTPSAIAISPDGSKLYVTNQSVGMVTVLDSQTFGAQTIQVGKSPSGIAVSADGTRVYETNSDSDDMYVINAVNNLTSSSITTGSGPIAFGNFIKNGSECTGTAVKFTITAVPGISSNADLANFFSKQVVFLPKFSATNLNYAGKATIATTSLTITPTAYDANATIKVNGVAVKSGAASQAIPLKVGYDTIRIVVTAQDGVTKKTYTAIASRFSSNDNLAKLKLSAGALSPVFSPDSGSYKVSVANAIKTLTVTPTSADSTATISVNGQVVKSGHTSLPQNLIAGNNIATLISIIVTAHDGITAKIYNIFITRAFSSNANLAALKLSTGALSPAFAQNTTSYTATVANGISSITLTPTLADSTATIKVNGVRVFSKTASAPIALAIGVNTIRTTITAQNGATVKTYTVSVVREPATNDNLAGLRLSAGATLSPAFAVATTSYTASVANSISIITLTATTAQTTSTVEVNGAPVASGSPSGGITLKVGANTIAVKVTAQDGVTTKTYTVAVTRAGAGANIPDESVSVEKPIAASQFIEDDIVVHQGVSPNGDGINDHLIIDGIVNHPDNKLTIINRNGILVYETKGYDNGSQVFDGHSSKTGALQLPGTYFYSLEYSVKGAIIRKTGFIILKY